jgi:hypothetical protein
VLNDPANISRTEPDNIARDEPFEAFADSEHFHFFVATRSDDRPNCGIHAGGIASARKYCYAVHSG